MARNAGPLVSVIVPVLDDRPALESLLATLRPDAEVELIVAQGGPIDPQLSQLLERREIAWTTSAPGRAVQMNTAARLARGRWLLFLHADCRLGSGWLEELRHLNGMNEVVGGSFRFVLASPKAAARVIEQGVRIRVRWLNLPYGDQALFVLRSVFDVLGGYASMPLMEDVELMRRLRRVGRLWHAETAVHVSPRRWERDGWIRRSIQNMLLVSLYFLGVAPSRLARLYYRVTPHSGASFRADAAPGPSHGSAGRR